MFTKEELLRYNRHLIIPEIGFEGQQKLKNAKVLVVGCGGLGNAMLPYLAAAGVGTLGIADFDTIEESNLQRQILFETRDVGKLKTEIISRKIKSINPYVNVISYPVKIDSQNAFSIIKEFDIIADGTDNFQTRYLVNDACVLLNKTNVFASIYRFDLQLSVFNYSGGPCYRCIFPSPPPAGSVPSCAEAGVLGVLPGIAGTLQANEIIKIITGAGDPLNKRLLILNTLDFTFEILTIDKNSSCPICGSHPTITRLSESEFQCEGVENDRGVKEVTVQQLQQWITSGENIQLIDVREKQEYDICNLKGEHVPLRSILDAKDNLSFTKKVIIHCKSGKRSEQAIIELQKKSGFKNLYNLKGGIMAWAREIDPEMRTY